MRCRTFSQAIAQAKNQQSPPPEEHDAAIHTVVTDAPSQEAAVLLAKIVRYYHERQGSFTPIPTPGQHLPLIF